MIAKEQKEALVLQDGEIEASVEMSLDENSTQMLMQMLSKNLYSDAIGSTIRETASNALDSHRKAEIKEPILVSFDRDENGNWEFSVEDFGIGLDSEDVKNIISKYGKSTKRESANQLGMFGLGFKSPLAYSSSFYFICRKDGIERKYMMYEGEKLNTIDLLYETETSHRNGVKVIVPVKSNDVYSFREKIKAQLSYFEDVWFDVKDAYRNNYISNDFKIIREEDWQYSQISTDSYLHMCLDNVYYPLNIRDLGIQESIQTSIALRFGLEDGIYPIPNRESIRIDEEIKQIILSKLTKVADWMVEKWNSSSQEYEDFNDIITFYESGKMFINVNGVDINIKPMLQFTDIKANTPKFKGIEKLNLKNVVDKKKSILHRYTVVEKLISGSVRKIKSAPITLDNIVDTHTVYIVDETVPFIFKEYIRSSFYNNISFVKDKRKIPLKSDYWNAVSYFSLCNLAAHHKSEWRSLILEFQIIEKFYASSFIPISSAVIPQEWKDEREKEKRNRRDKRRKEREKRTISNETIYGKYARQLYKSVPDKYCIFEYTNYTVKELSLKKGIVIYDLYENENRLGELYSITGSNKIKMLLSVSNREFKKLKNLNISNLITYEDFMKGENKLFRKIATGDIIKVMINENFQTFQKNGINLISLLSTNIADKMQKIRKYSNDHHSNASSPAIQAILELAVENDLFDYSIYPDYLEVKSFISKINIEELINKCSSVEDNYSKTLLPILVDVCKYRKIKLNLNHYSSSSVLIEEIEEEQEEILDHLEDSPTEEENVIEEDLDFPFN